VCCACYSRLNTIWRLACCFTACEQIPTAVPTQQLTTTTPTTDETNTTSVSFSAVISNITVAEFNETAFKAAVIEVINATFIATAVKTLQVVIKSTPQATATAALISDSSNRHLQATDNSVTVVYDVTNIPDTATANAIQTQLSSTDSNIKLLNRYDTLDNSTSATAITTTVLTKPVNTQTSGSKSLPIAAIIGTVIGLLAVAGIAYIIWRKRHSCTRSMREKQLAITDKQAVVTNSVADNTNKNNGGSFSRATATDNPRRNSSDRKSGSMLIDLDSGIVIDSVHDATSTNDDIECGTAATDSIVIDNSTVESAINNDSDIKQATIAVVMQPDSNDINSTNTATASSTTSNTISTEVPNVTAEATDTVDSTESATVAKTPFWTDKVVHASKSVTTATQKAVAAHGDKAVVAYEFVGAIAQHVPYIKTAYGLCHEVVQLFGAGVHIDSNCAEVVAWGAKHMQVCYCMYIYILKQLALVVYGSTYVYTCITYSD
jgi:hypothetical protein